MLKKLLFAILLMIGAAAFNLNETSAQTDETFPVRKSGLAGTNLPAGALKVKEEKIPAEISETLEKIIAAGGDKVRQGDSEVIMWTGGDYKKSTAAQLTKKLETALQSSGWTYEIVERNDGIILFSLLRETPRQRALFGFFAPTDDIYVLALTEMLAANAPATESENNSEKESRNNKSGGNFNSGNGNSGSVIGKWSRSEGGGFIDYTGKTRHKAGKTFTFEFFPDGTIEYVYDNDVLSIVQCRTKETSKARGKYTISGDTLTINLGAGNSVGSSSCETKGNFNKTMPASTVTKKFTVKRMDSITRPDSPWLLCFEGNDGDEACFERTAK
ncbi:MAG TPA: hypothetical protein VK308_04535 [Pyrinomonadaceae bacterium]|nr:hypothetical protein [Pyrinomonadaceae bacterium]